MLKLLAISVECVDTLQAQLTTVLIFWFLNLALIKHMYSDGSGSGFRPSRGVGFVRPSSIN
jgi:hypothetical protein